MIVGARRTSPPSRCTSWVEASIRVIDLVTRISAAKLRSHGRLAVHHTYGREVFLGGQRARPLRDIGGHVRLEPPEPNLVAVEETPKLRAGGVRPAAEDDRAELGRCRRARLQAFGPAEPVERELSDPLPDLGRGGGKRVVVLQLDLEYPRRLRCAEPTGVDHPERHRHLRENITGRSFADHALHAVDTPDYFDPTLEKAEQRPRVTLVDRGIAGRESDVRDDASKPLAFGPIEVREDRDPSDLLRRHH